MNLGWCIILSMPIPNESLSSTILDMASGCVRCGLCLPKCPTYQIDSQEAESPRGRIALLAAVARGELSIDPALSQHIDQCLSCRNCESVCPTQVPYEALLIQGRALLRTQQKTALPLLLRWMTHSTVWRHTAFHLGYCLQKARLPNWLYPRALQRYLDRLPKPLTQPFKNQGPYPATTAKRGSVALLLGCSSDVLEANTLVDAIRLLTHIGYEVVIPQRQHCCGALHSHAGQLSEAETFLKRNSHDLQAHHQQTPFDALIHFNSGCHSTWQRYTNLPTPVWEIQAFVWQHWPNTCQLKPLDACVTLHEPCSQRNSIAIQRLSHQLLSKIPMLRLQTLTANTCCGAAGAYFSQHPQKSEALARQLLTDVTQTDIVVSANVSCRLQLLKHWPSQGQSRPRFCHPVSLLALALGV